MNPAFLHWLSVAAGVLLAGAAGYYAAVLLAARGFERAADDDETGGDAGRDIASHTRSAAPGFSPPVSILKPVDGVDPGFGEGIRRHALQRYPEFELLFGVEDPHDPAVRQVRDLSLEFPNRRIEVFICECSPEGNSKVQRLERLAREARHETLLVNDSDVHVGPNYLRTVVGPLADPATGLVTCLYRARPGGGLPSLLEALWISAEFQAQVLLARGFQGVRFALGATMAFRRQDLERTGGFAALRPYLADDYQLGSRIARLGLQVVVSPYVVEIQHPPDTWRDVWRRQIRWSRTIRASRPWGHAGLLITHGTVWSLLALGLASTAGNWMLAAGSMACLGLRLGTAWSVGWKRLGSPEVRRQLLFMPLADLLSFGAWMGSFFTDVVHWRRRLWVVTESGELQVSRTPRPRPPRAHKQALVDR